MRSRIEVAGYINSGKCIREGKDLISSAGAYHFGLVELRNLMDFIYNNDEPKEEELISKIGD